MARREIGDWKLADADTQQAQGRVPNHRGHPADLMTAALHQFECDPAVRHVFAKTNRRIARRNNRLRIEQRCSTRQCAPPLDHHASLELRQCLVRRDPFDLRPVLTHVSIPRMEQARIECSLVSKEK